MSPIQPLTIEGFSWVPKPKDSRHTWRSNEIKCALNRIKVPLPIKRITHAYVQIFGSEGPELRPVITLTSVTVARLKLQENKIQKRPRFGTDPHLTASL